MMIVSVFAAQVFILAATSEVILHNSYTELEQKVLLDIDVMPPLLLKATIPHMFHQQVNVSVGYVLVALCICCAILSGIMLFFIRWAVVKRLAVINARVGEITRSGDVSARLSVRGDDELDQLAAALNGMLASLQSSERALCESEERYRSLFERAPDAILVIGMEGDEAGKIVAANQAAADQHGYTRDEINTMKIFELNAPETNATAPEMLQQIAAGQWITRDVWHLKKDGSKFPIEVHAGPLRVNGRTYILGFDRDITARMQTDESNRSYLEEISLLNTELAVQASNLEAANTELEAFNYSVSHDMRGPLTRISGYCQLLLDDENAIAAASRPYLERIYDSCCGLDELIDAMLELSRLSREPLRAQPVNLSQLITAALTSLQQAEPLRPVAVSVQPDVIVQGDVNLLKIVVDNLVNNAWKYSSRKPQTTIEFGALRENGETVCFIRDEGDGFDMKDAGCLFRTFARLHDATEFSGSGIGLATVGRIIARHNGKIWADGKPGQGATFFFTLAP